MFIFNVGYTFRADGRYFVLAERHKSKDTLGLYDTADSYRLVRVCRTYLWCLTNCDIDRTAFFSPNGFPIISGVVAHWESSRCMGGST